jgi:hypothetical protein
VKLRKSNQDKFDPNPGNLMLAERIKLARVTLAGYEIALIDGLDA